MKLHFLGANRQVTGSSYILEIPGVKDRRGVFRIMIDHGMFQERKFLKRNWEDCPVPAKSIDVLLLTHAHLDHCGRIPKLVEEGFRGRIITTEPSVELARIVMTDSGRIQEEDAKYKAKRFKKSNRKPKWPIRPLYDSKDAARAIKKLDAVSFGACHKLNDHATVCFYDAGHVLGSASLTVTVQTPEMDEPRTILFSGDVGQWNRPLIPDPTPVAKADYVVLESTYGDREHKDFGSVEDVLADTVNAAVERGGNVVIPTFAIERAQELLYHLGRLIDTHQIPRVPVFLDSPMAINVTELFEKNRSFLDKQTRNQLAAGDDPLDFPGLFMSRSPKDSRAINSIKGTAVILAGSGMCTGGRIKHHLKHNIGRPESVILFVGYQSPDTLGGQIVSGKEEIRIHGEMRPMRARVERLYGMSAHADRTDLLRWLDLVQPRPRRVFLTHGEESVAVKMGDEIRKTRKIDVTVPQYGEVAVLD